MNVTTPSLLPPGARGYIGGGHIAAILGVNPYCSPLEAWGEITGEIPPVHDARTRELFWWGEQMEPVILANYAHREGVIVRRQTPQKELVHPEYPWLRGHIDAEVLRDGGLRVCEAKNHDRFIRVKYGEEGTDAVPDYILTQGLFYPAIDRRYIGTDFPVCFGGNQGHTFRVDHDDTLAADIIAGANGFWFDYVVPRKPPEPRSEADLLRLFPVHRLALRTVGEELYDLVEEHAKLKAQLKELVEREKDLKFRLENEIRPHEGLEMDGRVLVTWKAAADAEVIDGKKVKADFPEVWDACKTTRPGGRRLLNKLIGKV